MRYKVNVIFPMTALILDSINISDFPEFGKYFIRNDFETISNTELY